MGDGLAVSDDAIAILEAPSESDDRKQALRRAFEGPPMFQRIQAEYDDKPSYETLKWWLNKQGFNPDGAEKSADIYLRSFDLVTENLGAYKRATASAAAQANVTHSRPADDLMAETARQFFERRQRSDDQKQSEPKEIAMGVHERVLQSGMLSKEASYRVIVSGKVGATEIDRLLKKLEMDKEILADPDPTSPMPTHGDDRDYQAEFEAGQSID